MRSSRPSTWWYRPGTLTPRRSATPFMVTWSRPTSYAARAIIARFNRAGRPTLGRSANGCAGSRLRVASVTCPPGSGASRVFEFSRARDHRTQRASGSCSRTSFRTLLEPHGGARKTPDVLTQPANLVYDPYDAAIDVAPHDVWRRLRDEAPLYYNEQYDFYALSRFVDVLAGVARLADLQLRPRHRLGDHRHDATAVRRARRRLRDDDLHGSATTRRVAAARQPCLHAAPGGRARGPDA